MKVKLGNWEIGKLLAALMLRGNFLFATSFFLNFELFLFNVLFAEKDFTPEDCKILTMLRVPQFPNFEISQSLHNSQLGIIQHDLLIAVVFEFDSGDGVMCTSFKFDNSAKPEFLVLHFLAFLQFGKIARNKVRRWGMLNRFGFGSRGKIRRLAACLRMAGG